MPDIEDLKTLAGRGGQLGQVTALQDTDALGLWRGASGSMQLGWAPISAVKAAMPTTELPIVSLQDIAGVTDDGSNDLTAVIQADFFSRSTPALYILSSSHTSNTIAINGALNNPRHQVLVLSHIKLGKAGQLRIAGSLAGMSTDLTADAVRGDRAVEVDDAAGFAPGDVVMLIDDKTAGDVAGSSAALIHVDLRYIASIDGTTISLDRPLDHDLATAFAARVEKVAARDGAVWAFGAGVKVEFTQAPDAAPAPRVPTTLIQYATRSKVIGLRVPNTDAFGTRGAGAQMFRALDCEVHELDVRDPKFTDGGDGACLDFTESSYCYGRAIHGTACRHVVIFNGGGHNLVEHVTSADDLLASISFHGREEVACGVRFGRFSTRGRQTSDGSLRRALRFGHPSTNLAGCIDCFGEWLSVEGYRDTSDRAIEIVPPSRGWRLSYVTTLDCWHTLHGQDVLGAPALIARDGLLDHCRIAGSHRDAVFFDGQLNGSTNATFDGITLRNVEIADSKRHLILRHIDRMKIDGGWLRDHDTGADSTASAIEAVDCPGLAVVGLKIQHLRRGPRLTDCPDAEVLLYPLALLDSPSGSYDGLWDDQGGNTGARVQDGFNLGGGA